MFGCGKVMFGCGKTMVSFQLGCGKTMVSFDAGKLIDRKWNYFQENQCLRQGLGGREKIFHWRLPLKIMM